MTDEKTSTARKAPEQKPQAGAKGDHATKRGAQKPQAGAKAGEADASTIAAAAGPDVETQPAPAGTATDGPSDTEPQHPKPARDARGRLLPGHTANPAGRPKGARHRLSKNFLLDVAQHWQEEGGDILKRVTREDPGTVLRVVASLVPRELITKMEIGDEDTSLRDITPDDLRVVSKLRRALADADGEVVDIVDIDDLTDG